MATPDKATAAQQWESIEVRAGKTPEDTIVKINGKEVKNFRELRLVLWNDGYPPHIDLSYTVSDTASDAGQLGVMKHYYLNPPVPEKTDATLQKSNVVPPDMLGRQPAIGRSLYASLGMSKKR